MKTVKYITLLFTSMLFLNMSLLAQDLKKDMEEMGLYYKNTEAFKSSIQVKIFTDKSGSSPLLQTASILKKGKSFYYEIGETKMLVFPASILMIYEKQKNIIYKTISEKEYEACLKRFAISNLDSIVSLYDSVSYVGIVDQQKHYIVYTSKGLISKTDFYIDVTSKSISKLTYYYNQNISMQYSKVQIVFNNQHTFLDSDNSLLNEKKYISREGKNIKTGGSYSHYHLINTDHED